MNSAIDDFVNTFQDRFYNFLIDPQSFNEYSRLEGFSKYFKFFYNKKPDNRLSDWDLACWLNLEMIGAYELHQINNFIKSNDQFSHVGLFTTDYDQVKHLHYMAYTPNQSFAPFLDLHIRGDIGDELFHEIYSGDVAEHQLWTVLTAWRKINKGELDRARQTFNEQNRDYWPNDIVDKFTNDPQSFFQEKFPNLDVPRSLSY